MAGSEVGNHLMVRQQAARIDWLQPVWLLVTCAVGSGPGDVSCHCAVGRMQLKGGALGSFLYLRRIQLIGLVQY